MKLRTTTNSIRIRVRKSDLAKLKADGVVREKVAFPGGAFYSFSLQADIHAPEIHSTFEAHDISIIIPQSTADEWIKSDRVGLETHLPLSPDEALHLLVEKDFSCGDRDFEDMEDFFPELIGKDDSC